jgi:hypothetical protein
VHTVLVPPPHTPFVHVSPLLQALPVLHMVPVSGG